MESLEIFNAKASYPSHFIRNIVKCSKILKGVIYLYRKTKCTQCWFGKLKNTLAESVTFGFAINRSESWLHCTVCCCTSETTLPLTMELYPFCWVYLGKSLSISLFSYQCHGSYKTFTVWLRLSNINVCGAMTVQSNFKKLKGSSTSSITIWRH